MGAERTSRRERVIQRLKRLRQEIIVLYPDSPDICQHYAEQLTAMKTAGTPIGATDLWVARHAMTEGAKLVTNKIHKFQRITGLRLQNWAA